MIDELKQEEIKDTFKKRMIANKIKYKSKTYYIEQASFFAGILTALGLNNCPPIWAIACSCNREIIDEYKL